MNIELSQLHEVLQKVFRWKDRHLHDWNVYDGKSRELVVRLVMSDEDLAYDDKAILEAGSQTVGVLSKVQEYHLYLLHCSRYFQIAVKRCA